MTTTQYVVAAFIAIGLVGILALVLMNLFSQIGDLNRNIKLVRAEAVKAGEKACNDAFQQMIKRETLEARLSGMSERIDELARELETRPASSTIDRAIKSEAERREILEERLRNRMGAMTRKIDGALMRLGIDPHTGSTLDGATPIDARGPLALAQHALNSGNAAGSVSHLVEAIKDVVLAEVKSGESSRAQPVRGPHCHTVAADFVHHPHGDLSAETAKLLRITEPGRHAVVVNVAEAG